MKLSILGSLFMLLILIASPLWASDWVVSGLVTEKADCQSGFAFREIPVDPNQYVFGESTLCIDKTKAVDLKTLVNQIAKFRAHRHYGYLTIKRYNPSEAVGSRHGGIMDHIGSGMVDAAQGLEAAEGGGAAPTPAPAETSPTPGNYASNLNQCVSGLFEFKYERTGFAYRNNCAQPIHLTYLRSGGGTGGSMELASGATGGTGDSPENMKTYGDYRLYACPAHYLPVGLNDAYVTVGTVDFRCKAQGY